MDKAGTIINYLDSLIIEAMKSGNKNMLSLYRLAKTEMIKYQKDKAVEESAIDSQAVFKSMKKKLEEEIESYQKAGLAAYLQQQQLEWVEAQLPKPVTEREIRSCITNYLLEYPSADFGKVMKAVKFYFNNKNVDMKLASQVAKELLEKK